MKVQSSWGKSTFSFLHVFLVFFLLYCAKSPLDVNAQAGEPFPDFEKSDLNDNLHRFTDYRDTVVLFFLINCT